MGSVAFTWRLIEVALGARPILYFICFELDKLKMGKLIVVPLTDLPIRLENSERLNIIVSGDASLTLCSLEFQNNSF